MGDRDIDKYLAEVAETENANEGVQKPRYRNRAKAANPSQVYSIRMPVGRVDEVRQLAAARGVAPTVMLRDWVIERLDREGRGESHRTHREPFRMDSSWTHWVVHAWSVREPDVEISRSLAKLEKVI